MSESVNIEINALYMLESEKTNRPYVDTSGASYVFLKEEQAMEFSSLTPGTRVSPPKYYKLTGLSKLCYAAGADTLVVTAGQEKTQLEIKEENLPIDAYNHLLNSVLSQILQTEDPKYLDYLAECEFIIPSKTTNGEKVEIIYSIARHKVEEYGTLYVAFSSLAEYTAWAIDVRGWSPLKVSWTGLWRVAKKAGVILDPGGSQFILTRKMMKDIEAKRAKAEAEAKAEAAAAATTEKLEKDEKENEA